MAETAVRSYVCLSFVLVITLFTSNVSMELTSLRSSGNIALSENQAPEWSNVQPRARGATRADNPFVGRQTSTTSNVSINQLAENLNRVEGNLASLIQSFLALQRSVFNLEQLQELLVLLLEDILKQTGNMDQGGGVKGAMNPTSSVSNESLDMDDDGVDSPEIDQDGDDTSLADDRGGDEEEKGGGGNDGGEVKGDKKGGGGEGDKNQEGEPFGALNDLNTVSMTSHNRPNHQESQTPVENKEERSNGGGDSVLEEMDDSEDDSSDMDGSDSLETGRVVPRTNDVQPKPASPNVRETAVPRKPQINEPLVTFAAQLEERLHDMMQRLSPFLGGHDGRMASMRQAHSSSSNGESPMAPPPRFEPLEIVASNDAWPAKRRRAEVLPVKLKLQPIVSHGGPLVGPEDFSSPFMENLGGKAKASGESLNERSTGMINNMVQLDQSAPLPPTHMHPSQPSTSHPKILPGAMDRRPRRQTEAEQAGLAQHSYTVTNSSLPAPSDNSNIQITFVNVTSEDSKLINRSHPINTTVQPTTDKYAILPTKTTPTMSTPPEDFDVLIAKLLHDLSQHLKQQYLTHKHNASVGKDIDRSLLELDKIIWIPATTPSPSVSPSRSDDGLGTQSSQRLVTTPTIATPQSSSPPKQEGKERKHQSSDKTGSTTLRTKERRTGVTKHGNPLVKDPKHKYDVAGAQMDNEVNNDRRLTTSVPEKGSSDTSTESPFTNTSNVVGTDPRANKPITGVTNATKSFSQWDWLRQLHPGGRENDGNVEWLIDTLSSLSQLTIFSDELKSISDRGKRLTKDRSKASVQNQRGADETSSQEELDSGEASSHEENEDESLARSDDGIEDFTDIVGHHLTTVKYTTKKEADSKDRDTAFGSKTSLQHENTIFGRLDEKQTNNNVNDVGDNNDVALGGEEEERDSNGIGATSDEGSEEVKEDLDVTKEQDGENDFGDDTEEQEDDVTQEQEEEDEVEEEVEEEEVEEEEVEEGEEEDGFDNDTKEQPDGKNDSGTKEQEYDEDEDGKEEPLETQHDSKTNDVKDEDSKGPDTTQNTIKSSPNIMLSNNKESKVKVDMKSDESDDNSKNNYNSGESNETDDDNVDDDYQTESRDEESDEMTSSESLTGGYSVTDLNNQDTQVLESPSQFDDVTIQLYNNHFQSQVDNKHDINKRHAHLHKHRVPPLLPLRRTSKQVYQVKRQSPRRKRRQVPSFWQFLYGNTAQLGNHPQQTLGPQAGLSQNLENLFSFRPNLQDQTRHVHNLQLGQSPLSNNPQLGHSPHNHFQPGNLPLRNPQPGNSFQDPQLLDNSPLQNPQLGNSPLHNSQLGNSPLDNPQLENSLGNPNPQLGKSPVHNPQFGNSPVHNPQFGNSPLDNPQLENSPLQNQQRGNSFHDPQLGNSPSHDTRLGNSALNNPRFGNSPLNNPQFGNSPLNNPQFGNSPLNNPQFGNSPLNNPQFGNSPPHDPRLGNEQRHNTQVGNFPLPSQQFGNPPTHNTQLEQPPKETLEGSAFQSFNQQRPQQNMLPPLPLSRNFPFHPPIGGYPQYHRFQGFHYPQFGYPGYSNPNYEPGESPGAEAAADMEEVLTGLFNRYWENVRNLFTTKGPKTTPEYEYEGPITTTKPTTAKAAAAASATTTMVPTTATKAATTATMSATKLTTLPSTTAGVQPTSATNTTALPNITTTMISIPITNNASKVLDPTLQSNTTSLNSTAIIANQVPNNSSVSNNNTTTNQPSLSTALPQVEVITVPNPNPQPNRGNTLLFNLIKSLELMTRKPTA